MQLENSFEVDAPADAAWALLNDVPAVVPCMPGAELVDVASEDAWRAKLHVKLGPIALQFVADHLDELRARHARHHRRHVVQQPPGGVGRRVDLEAVLQPHQYVVIVV